LNQRIKDSLTLLEDLRIPNTLGHLDLNPWNIVVSADGGIFLDWAEAYLGHPFFCVEYALEHFRREICADAVLESELVNAYKAPWCQLLSGDLTSEALALTPLRDPRMGAYLRSLARRMNREAIQFIDRRAACLS
jgi:hypothetical protein